MNNIKIKIKEFAASLLFRLKRVLPRGRYAAFICIPAALCGVAFALLLIGGADSDGTSPPVQKDTENAAISDALPDNSLDYQSLGNGTCIVMGLGGFEGSELYIPDTSPQGDEVIGIGNGAFEDCDSLVSVSIPRTVSSIGKDVFVGCSSLVLISVDSANASYRSHGGVLYSKDRSLLICCPPSRIGESFLLDSGVRKIEANAFYGNKNIERILYESSTADFELIEIGEGNEDLLALPITCNYKNAK